jgi:hypothetical protein
MAQTSEKNNCTATRVFFLLSGGTYIKTVCAMYLVCYFFLPCNTLYRELVINCVTFHGDVVHDVVLSMIFVYVMLFLLTVNYHS